MMSIIIRDDDFRRVSAELGGVIITDTTSGNSLAASLSADERSHLATALAPDRQAVSGCRCDELRSLIEGQKANVTKAQRERDAAIARAERAERELHRARSDQRLAACDRIADHPFFADCYQAEGSLIDAMIAKLDAHILFPDTPAISREELAKAIQGGWGPHRVLDAVWALVSGDDPAVHVVRESDIAAVKVERVRDEEWHADGTLVAWTGESAEDVRGQQDTARRNFIHREAVARAIEAEAVVDPVEAEAAMAWAEYRKDYQPNPDDLTAAHKAFTSGYQAARHVLGQEE